MAAKYSLDSFDRKILDCLQDDADMALAEIARRVGLHKSSVSRILSTLEQAGYVERDPNRRVEDSVAEVTGQDDDVLGIAAPEKITMDDLKELL